MIQEIIITTQNREGRVHIAPMGVHVEGDQLIIMPFRPSATLDNILATRTAVLNYCDDVRVFAGCLTGRRNFPLMPAKKIDGFVLKCALAHSEIKLIHIEEDSVRPKLFCKEIHKVNHAPFTGFNRAAFSVVEAAILISRLNMLPLEKVDAEMAYLTIGFEKTAGAREREAWGWIKEVLKKHRREQHHE